ncbi:penicillin-binding protein 2, partial [Cupriavidus pauculus]
VPAARAASDSIAAQLDPAAIAPASAEVTLDARMLQALGHSKPPASAPSAPAPRATPASAPAPKPRAKPAKPVNVAEADAARNRTSE